VLMPLLRSFSTCFDAESDPLIFVVVGEMTPPRRSGSVCLDVAPHLRTYVSRRD